MQHGRPATGGAPHAWAKAEDRVPRRAVKMPVQLALLAAHGDHLGMRSRPLVAAALTVLAVVAVVPGSSARALANDVDRHLGHGVGGDGADADRLPGQGHLPARHGAHRGDRDRQPVQGPLDRAADPERPVRRRCRRVDDERGRQVAQGSLDLRRLSDVLEYELERHVYNRRLCPEHERGRAEAALHRRRPPRRRAPSSSTASRS